MDSDLLSNGSFRGRSIQVAEIDDVATAPAFLSRLHPSSLPSSPSSIRHRVSQMDTLAGVAIKYGVEVSDIKRLNGLVTDLQMFAHKSLQIPQPGRHPASPVLSDGSVENRDHSSSHLRRHSDVQELIEAFNLSNAPCKVSPAMTRLQGYYGLSPVKRRPGNAERIFCKTDDEGSPSFGTPPSRHRKSRSLMHEFSTGSGEGNTNVEGAENGEADLSVRRRQRCDVRPSFLCPEVLLKEEGNSGFPGRIGKCITPRAKAAINDSAKTEEHFYVRKSSSTACLLSTDSENSSSMWSGGMWNSKPDALPRPLLDGFPKSLGARRYKAALD
ncbi:uncharacterized protein LOC122028233 [Zingiber officinale]|uniref:uncharacterized protein LOC122028233 n=1 Tax=Zingiber officinale TaxID=94328 RepID=UPI001C4C8CD8|nr:uncharacterized protein LOC122028233 [Zingiber officinale]XP_042443204.1 uncharacterized protein LOC122028233 [Zingiber officinale]